MSARPAGRPLATVIEQHIGDPAGGGEFGAIGEAHGLAALELEQSGAGDGIERLDTPPDQHGEASEGDRVRHA